MKRIAIALFAAAVATASYAADGAALYAAKCKMCHGPHAEGGKMDPKPIAGTSATQVKKAIVEGHGKMKPVKMSGEDATAVAEHVAGLKRAGQSKDE